jgi:hypothetical protein
MRWRERAEHGIPDGISGQRKLSEHICNRLKRQNWRGAAVCDAA